MDVVGPDIVRERQAAPLTMRSTSLEVRQVPTTEHSQPAGICQIFSRFLTGGAAPADAAGNDAVSAAVSGRARSPVRP
jgi:hypothetical protein